MTNQEIISSLKHLSKRIDYIRSEDSVKIGVLTKIGTDAIELINQFDFTSLRESLLQEKERCLNMLQSGTNEKAKSYWSSLKPPDYRHGEMIIFMDALNTIQGGIEIFYHEAEKALRNKE